MSIWDMARRIAWPLAAGMLAAVLLVTAFGTHLAWIAFVLVAFAALFASGVAVRMRPAFDPSGSGRDDASASGVPPLARDVFERLPDPLMLLGGSERAICVTRAMRAVIGVDAERKHVSALLRTPSVLAAIRRSAARGEPTQVEFTSPVPVQRYYKAYSARIGGSPVVTILLLHDLTAMK